MSDKMEIIGKYGKDDLAILYIAKMDNGQILEFVESTQPPIPREKKWVLIISTMFGCPIQCLMCDAGEYYAGNVSKEQMLEEIDFLIKSRFLDTKYIDVPKFKIQFARMGEPALNDDVLEVIRELPSIYDAPGLMPCISTVAPRTAREFMEKLLVIKDQLYSNGKFQLQFSIHSTNEEIRKKLMTSNIWTLEEIAEYGQRWFKEGDRKITLNFAVAEDYEIDPSVLKRIFDPLKYLIKITPINPTNKAIENNLESAIKEENEHYFPLVEELRKEGFDTLISIGEWEENKIGTNCGQFATKYNKGQVEIKETYLTTQYKLN
ncbi:MAG: radical SAM protein [Candidatus Heimdallarchaeaceae archaeon]